MKKLLISIVFVLFALNGSYAQAWMTSLDIAQKLATVQDKMVFMVWEESTKYNYHVFVNDNEGKAIFISNLFEDETLSPLIWEHFVPVIVNENQYETLYSKLKGKRSQKYMDKFNDDSIKIMDVNGNILNVSYRPDSFQNITTLIQDYALNTKFLALELQGYQQDKDFYAAYFLASKYLDFSMYMKAKIRPELIDLSHIYLDEAESLIDSSPVADQKTLAQRVELLRIQENLITKRPKKVLRQLKRMDAENVESSNIALAAFLYYTAYKILKDETNAELWKSKISSVNLRKAQLIYNLNNTK